MATAAGNVNKKPECLNNSSFVQPQKVSTMVMGIVMATMMWVRLDSPSGDKCHTFSHKSMAQSAVRTPASGNKMVDVIEIEVDASGDSIAVDRNTHARFISDAQRIRNGANRLSG